MTDEDQPAAVGPAGSASAKLAAEFPADGSQAAAGESAAETLLAHPEIGGAIVITVWG